MICRHCGAAIEKGREACPQCQMPVSKFRVVHIVLLSIAALVLICALVLLIMKDQGVDLGWADPAGWFQSKTAQTNPPADSGTAPTTGTQTEATIPFEFELERDGYTVSGDALEGKVEQVVATIGDVELTNAELQAYYWYGVYNFVTQFETYYGYDLTLLGLDVSKPFDQQVCMDGQNTWQHFFLQAALADWHKYNALALEGEKAGHVMSQEMTDSLNNLFALAEENWKAQKYASLDAMIKAELGPLCDEESYRAYMKTYYYAMDYFEIHYQNLEPTQEEIENYYTAHEAELSFTKETKKHDVRHILIEPRGGTTDESGITTYTDAEIEACKAEAQKILDSWNGTEEGFAKLAKEKSADPGSAENGGLYEDLTDATNFVEEFKAWYLDPERKPGDTGLVQSSYGYHIMYYSGGETIWQEQCKALAWQYKSEDFITGIKKTWPVTLYEEQIAIAEIYFK